MNKVSLLTGGLIQTGCGLFLPCGLRRCRSLSQLLHSWSNLFSVRTLPLGRFCLLCKIRKLVRLLQVMAGAGGLTQTGCGLFLPFGLRRYRSLSQLLHSWSNLFSVRTLPLGRFCLLCKIRKLVRLLQVMAGAGGFEPPNDGIKTRCLAAWRRPSKTG